MPSDAPARPTALPCAAVALASFAADAVVFRVGAGIGCTHSSIQAAINAASVAPGHDTILVTQSLVYLNQALTIRDQDVELIGAYTDCRSRERDGLVIRSSTAQAESWPASSRSVVRATSRSRTSSCAAATRSARAASTSAAGSGSPVGRTMSA